MRSRRVAVRITVLFTAVCAAVGVLGSGDVASASHGGKIVFTSCRGGECDLWTMAADGSGQRRVIGLPYPQTRPKFSPDGRTIVFESTHHGDGTISLYSVKADGTGLRRLTRRSEADWDPEFSPDGRVIAFARTRNGQNDIWLMTADGSTQRQLTNTAVSEGEPTWSSDGRSIVYTSDQGGTSQVWRMWLNSTRTAASIVSRLTTTGTNLSPDYVGCGNRSTPTQRIAFVSVRVGNYEVYEMRSSGTDQKRVTSNPAVDASPSWAPQGGVGEYVMAFESNRLGRGTRAIYVRKVGRFGPYDVKVSAGSAPFDMFPDFWGSDICPPEVSS